MKRLVTIGFLLTVVLFTAGICSAGEDSMEYSLAKKAAQGGNKDFAFMHYGAIARNYPNSKYRLQSLFATAEYKFLLPNYNESAASFESFLQASTDSRMKLFALGYLLAIAEKNSDTLSAEKWKAAIMNLRQTDPAFNDTKTLRYRSPLYRWHKAVFGANTIELRAEGELLANIAY